VKWLCETKIPKLKENTLVKTLLSKLFSVKQITQLVADYYKPYVNELIQVVKDPQKGLKARKVAMYLCQELGGHKLDKIFSE